LLRRFGKPPVRSEGQAAWLRLGRVPGLQSVRLNGQELAPSRPSAEPLEFFLGELSERNELELDLDRPEAGEQAWGEAALVIRPGPEAAARHLA
jgi:hypothetical protein